MGGEEIGRKITEQAVELAKGPVHKCGRVRGVLEQSTKLGGGKDDSRNNNGAQLVHKLGEGPFELEVAGRGGEWETRWVRRQGRG